MGHEGCRGALGHGGGKRLDEVGIRLEVLVGPAPAIEGQHIEGGRNPERGGLLDAILGEAGQLAVLLGSPWFDRLALASKMPGHFGGELPVDRPRLIEQFEQFREQVVTHESSLPSVTSISKSASALTTPMTTC